jgi:hypothetical protein
MRLSLLGDAADVNCVTDNCASSLRDKEFFFPPTPVQHPRTPLRSPVGTAYFRAQLTAGCCRDLFLEYQRVNDHTSCRPAKQRYKGNRPERFLVDPLLLAREADELLLAFGTYRHEQPAADFQLLDECFGHGQRGGSH